MKLFRKHERQSGFTMVEALISLTVLSLVMIGLGSLLVHNSKVNKSEQMKAETQANARNTLSVIVQRLRSAGWDPLGSGSFAGISPDSNTGDTVAEITMRMDFTSTSSPGTPDGIASELDEIVVFQHSNNQIIWDRDDDGNFEILAVDISNDADGNGTIEDMFVLDSTTDPTRVTVQITARSPVVDPLTRDFSRFTVSSDVIFRKEI